MRMLCFSVFPIRKYRLYEKFNQGFFNESTNIARGKHTLFVIGSLNMVTYPLRLLV